MAAAEAAVGREAARVRVWREAAAVEAAVGREAEAARVVVVAVMAAAATLSNHRRATRFLPEQL